VQSITDVAVEVASRITGWGMNLPERVVTNDHFASYLETSDEWIRERTGIAERRWAAPDVSASMLAEPACRRAVEKAGLDLGDIDGIVVATVTPDYTFPGTACVLQKRLGIKKGFAFDVNAVCSGFVYALVTADSLIASGQARNILVVGVDLFSRLINPQDRSTSILFGDGAGAVVLSSAVPASAGAVGVGRKRTVSGSSKTIRGVYGCKLRSDGSSGEILGVPCGTASQPTPESLQRGDHYLQMAGREVFKLAVRSLVEISEELLSEVGVAASDVDYFVSHQANQRILDAMARNMGLSAEKVLSNVSRYGNTSAASVPVLLAESIDNGPIKPGNLLLISAFGGGLTWGAALVRL
jgi:3-oxoacyl-[acyl-carrier-protein] synthase-3